MIVSKQIAVLPVFLSPIISSLCPLPMGTIESMAFIPVCRDDETSFLLITPGASYSRGLYLLLFIRPFESRGYPKAFITLPIKGLPTAILATSEVR